MTDKAQVIADFDIAWAALCAGDIPALDSLCKTLPDFPHGVDSWVGRRWIINAIDSHSSAAVNWMIGKGVPLVFRDEEGRNVLQACLEHFEEHKVVHMHDIMRALIAAGADVDLKGLNDWTPLHFAIACCDIDSIRILLESSADRTIKTDIDEYESAEEMAFRDSNPEILKLFHEIPGQKK